MLVLSPFLEFFHGWFPLPPSNFLGKCFMQTNLTQWSGASLPLQVTILKHHIIYYLETISFYFSTMLCFLVVWEVANSFVKSDMGVFILYEPC